MRGGVVAIVRHYFLVVAIVRHYFPDGDVFWGSANEGHRPDPESNPNLRPAWLL